MRELYKSIKEIPPIPVIGDLMRAVMMLFLLVAAIPLIAAISLGPITWITALFLKPLEAKIK